MLAALALCLSGCFGLERKETSDGTGVVEPEVFDIVRASNSKATLDHLRRRYHQEAAQARLLENQIQNLISAQAGLANSLQAYQEDFADAEREVGVVQERTRATETALAEQRALAEQSTKELEATRESSGATRAEVEQLRAGLAALEAERGSLEAACAAMASDLELLRGLRALDPSADADREALREQLEALLQRVRELPPREAFPADAAGGSAAEGAAGGSGDPTASPEGGAPGGSESPAGSGPPAEDSSTAEDGSTAGGSTGATGGGSAG